MLEITKDRKLKEFIFSDRKKIENDGTKIVIRAMILEGTTKSKRKFFLFMVQYSPSDTGFYLRLYSMKGKFATDYLFVKDINLENILQFLK